MVTFKIKDELDECIYFEVIYFQKEVKKWTKNAQIFEEYVLLAQANFGVEMAF